MTQHDMHGWFGRLRRFAADRQGVGAVEFALLMPILLVVYFASFEMSVGFSASLKLDRAASTITDIVAQLPKPTKAYLTTTTGIVKSMMTPYDTTRYTMKISGISVVSAGRGKIAWSIDEKGNRAYTLDSQTVIPNGFTTAGTFLVRTELTLPYKLWFPTSMKSSVLPTEILMSKTYYFVHRLGTDVACADC